MKSIAVIPARGGSKRIPKKNIKTFLGLPIIAYSIKVAQQSSLFERIIVSTDNEEIAKIARCYGAEVPFIRPSEIADDFSSTLDVIAHAVEVFNEPFDAVCCIYATAPFITEEDLYKGRALLCQDGVEYSFPAVKMTYPFQRSFKVSSENYVQMFFPENLNTRSQDLEEAFHDAGQFYWGTKQAFLKHKPIFGPTSKAHIIPSYRVQDIDTEEDWLKAEMMYEVWQRMGCE